MITNSNPSGSSNMSEDFSLTETRPSLGGRRVPGNDRIVTAFDLVEQMHYLYVKVVKAKELPPTEEKDVLPDPYVEVKLGNFTGLTRHFDRSSNPEWNQVFVVLKERIQSSVVEIVVKDHKDNNSEGRNDFIGGVAFEIKEVPQRVPPDSALAPQWYWLENRSQERVRGELMLAVWMGTQADEAFQEAWHLDALWVSGDGVASIRSKVYLSPRLWYVRVNVIEAQELQFSDRNRQPDVFVKAALGNLVLRTKSWIGRNVNPLWNEDLMFVVAEPFEEQLVLSVEDKVAANWDDVLGHCRISLLNVEKRTDQTTPSNRWYTLEKLVMDEGGQVNLLQLNSKLHLRICLEGGYHVLDELTQYSSNLRATAPQLGKPSIGVLELGILNGQGLAPMKTRNGRGTTDAYCVAKYGQKWIRTRTIIESLNPSWNEQYTWEVFDPCTVITIVVFDNSHLQGVDNGRGSKDLKIGKVRIRLSTLETDRVYTHLYPLIVLQPSGVKKMGVIQLAVRFSSSSMINLLQMYIQPMLPRMHYLLPLTSFQQDSLRHQATQIVSMRMSRAEPPLRKEVVDYMLDVGSLLWSVRKSKANYYRMVEVCSFLDTFLIWFQHICLWESPFKTIIVHLLFLLLVVYPQIILSTVFSYFLFTGLCKYRSRPRHPPHMDIKLSFADRAHVEELDEEFDTFPTRKQGDVLKIRYDRLRSVASRVQSLAGDMVTQGERFQNLLSWRDPRATAMFLIFCFIAAVVLYVTPSRLAVIIVGIFVLRHPRFRDRLPCIPINFFKRLPTRTDGLL